MSVCGFKPNSCFGAIEGAPKPLNRQNADRLETAISDVLEKGLRTADIAGGATTILSTSQMGDAILAQLQATV